MSACVRMHDSAAECKQFNQYVNDYCVSDCMRMQGHACNCIKMLVKRWRDIFQKEIQEMQYMYKSSKVEDKMLYCCVDYSLYLLKTFRRQL